MYFWQLLEKEANKRLGSCENGAQEVMGHSFFNGLDWDRLERRELVPPFKPNVVSSKQLLNYRKSCFS